MDQHHLPGPDAISDLECSNAGPSSSSDSRLGQGGDDEARAGATVRHSGLLAETTVSSSTQSLRDPLVADDDDDPPTDAFPVPSAEALGQPIAEGGGGGGGGGGRVVVGLEAPNSAHDFRQEEEELAGPAEAAGQGEANPGREGVLERIRALITTVDDFQRREEPAVSGGVGVAGQSEVNPGGGSVVVAIPAPNSIIDFQQEEPAGPVEGVGVGHGGGHGARNAGDENVVVELHAPRGEDDLRREEVGGAVPVFVAAEDPKKRSLGLLAEQLELGSLQPEQTSDEGDSLVCPICLEPWTNTGDHRICSLACGHLFGNSCIRRWLRQVGRKASRCPQCNKRAKWEDLRALYVPRTLAVVDGEAQLIWQEVRALRDDNQRLKLENKKLVEEIRQVKGKFEPMEEPAASMPSLAGNAARTHFSSIGDPTNNVTGGSESLQNLRDRGMVSTHSSVFGFFSGQASDARNHSAIPSGSHSSSSRAGSFQLQSEVRVHGGKVFDMDAESQTLIFSNRVEGSGNSFGLSKMSLLSCTDVEKIHLPPGFGAIRDIRLSPSGIGGTGKCALVASTGKKLSLLSLESNNIVLSYSVQSPPWSCVWDPHVPNLCYSGLQNGALLLVDLRQTSSPVAMLNGPSIRPIHSLQVVPGQFPIQQSANTGHQPLGGREILSASNTGISLWHLDSSFAGSEIARPQCVFSDKDTVCVSLVYEFSINSAVASFRRSPVAQAEPSSSVDPGLSQGRNSSEPLDGLWNRRLSPPANSCEEPGHWIFTRGQESSWSQLNDRVITDEFRLPWEKMGEMVGNRSQSLTPRTAIIPQSKSAPRSKSLFACGDEGTNSVWLWDMSSCRLTDTLVPHQSPILDVKNVQVQEHDVLGSLSEGTFQLYKRIPLSE